MLRRISFQDWEAYAFEGCLSLEKGDSWVSPWRIPYDRRDFYPFLKDDMRSDWTAPPAQQCSGVRLRFTSDTESLRLEMENPDRGMILDLYADSLFRERLILDGTSPWADFSALPPGLKNVEIWLDQRHAFRLKSLAVEEGSRIFRTGDGRKRWVHYGSSISHSRQADAPSLTWTAQTARRLDLHLTNLGFAANCMLEPMAARMIGDLPADYITLKLGINVHCGHLTERTFPPALLGMVQIIREKHPRTPLVLISPLFSSSREKERMAGGGLSLEEMRRCHRDAVDICRSYGDENIFHVDGLSLFGPQEALYLPDEVHPDGEGQTVLAERFITHVFRECLSGR